MADDYPEIPHFLDRKANGRCRAWWMAYEACPGNQQPYEWATKHVEEYVERAAAMDLKDGVVSGCRDPNAKVMTPAPIRKRERPIRRRTRATG